MTLRTPRRRISPRTKRRYRAIKDFIRRALGSSSQPSIKINSSIAINVTDLKHKIVGLEQQLSEVNKRCLDLICLENNSRRDSQALVLNEDGNEFNSLKEQTEVSSIRKCDLETKLLYKTSESHYRNSDDSVKKGFNEANGKHMVSLNDMGETYIKESKKKKKNIHKDMLRAHDTNQPYLRRHTIQSASENFVSSYSTSSYQSLVNLRNNDAIKSAYPESHYDKRCRRREYMEVQSEKPNKLIKPKDYIKRISLERPEEHYESKHKTKPKKLRKVDEEFIADIIKRQYRPIKMFGRKESGISQFSAPVCRDQEYSIRENILEGSELCSCCFDGHKKSRYERENDLSDMRSICDTRLYSSKRQARNRRRRKCDSKRHDIYNDSELYDLIPVREKASPKPWRKAPVEEMIPYNYYREVPPSPRTLRPRLNLKAQYYDEFEEFMQHKKHLAKNRALKKYKNQCKHEKLYDSNESSFRLHFSDMKENKKSRTCNKVQNDSQIQHDAGTLSSLQSPLYSNNRGNTINSTLNKTQDTDISANKSDKALSEIKGILQSFLQEIKKETAASQCDNSDVTTKHGDKCINELRQDGTKLNTSMMPNSGLSVNNFGVPQCSLPPSYMPITNPCCYPVFPVCPMNCMQNGFVLPSPSFTCASCVNNAKDAYSKHEALQKETVNNITSNNETEELIKEIYKYVAQNPNNSARKEHFNKKDDSSHGDNTYNKKILTSRSVGESCKLSKHDVKVGTQKIKCYSKSCEAIGSKVTSDTYYTRTNPTYSDTVLERLSLEVTATSSESEVSSDSSPVKKGKQNKFVKVLQSFGLLKKKKNVIEEMSESESTVEVNIKPKPPFQQKVINYMMHGQEYYNQPPVAPLDQCHARDYRHCQSGCMQGTGYENCPCHRPHGLGSPFHSTPAHPSAPPYPSPYNHHVHNQPQVPLCLKEIEVKSIGTQSVRKINFFRKFTNKMHGPAVEHRHDESGARNCFTQTAGQSLIDKPHKLGKFNWKALQAKVNELDKPDNLNFSYKTQKRLAEGDTKMRNAMLKKLFYKRNPFSPRNLIVRTILGKDKSSYGEPPAMYRPRMFF